MSDAKTGREQRIGPAGKARPEAERRTYRPPRIVKKRAVSSATLYSGTGASAAGIVGNPTN